MLLNAFTVQPKAVSHAWYCCQEQVYTWQQMLSISFLRGTQTVFSFQPLFVERHWVPRVDLCCQSFAGEGKQMALSGVQTGPG